MKVAVLLATYNRAQKVNGVPMIERSINSFLDQDYKNSDLIILNDCSTDETPQILSKYEGNERITIYHSDKNKVPPNNWNWLWGKVTDADLICQLHDDDNMTKNSISIRVSEFQHRPDYQVVYGGVNTQNINGEYRRTVNGEPPSLDRILKEEYINFVSLMYRPTLEFRFDPELRYYFDWLFKIRCLKECAVGYVVDPVMNYTEHIGQETNKCRREKMNEPDEQLMREKLKLIYG